MKAKTLVLAGMLTILVLTVVPVLAQSSTVAAPRFSADRATPLIMSHTDVTPTINVTPLEVSSQQAMGTLVTKTLVISNTGSGDLVWQTVESDVARPKQVNGPAAMEIIQDGGFEDGHPNPYWAEYSESFDNQVIVIGAGPHTGNWWVWFGGAGNLGSENAYISQTMTIPRGLAKLSFWMKMDAAGSGNFTVTLDSTIIFTANQTMTATYPVYTQVTRDVTAFADGRTHVLKLAESDPATPGSFNVNLDDVSLKVIDCAPANLPWLTVSPISGTTTAGGSSPIDLVFNSVGRAGIYTGTVCIVSNDPTHEVIKVPVTLESMAVFLPLLLR